MVTRASHAYTRLSRHS